MGIEEPGEEYQPAPRRRGLRTGYTTGACAAAATTAACRALSGNDPQEVGIRLPAGVDANFRIHRLVHDRQGVSASVIKDAGDDPDVTHGAEIGVTIKPRPERTPGGASSWKVTGPGRIARRLAGGLTLELVAGPGVGTVTKPGIGIPVGGPAINRVPRRMIASSVRHNLAQSQGWLSVTVWITDGARLAQRTLNGRLGIVGGLSVLGTTGIVRPYSTASWRASVLQGVDVAHAQGCQTIVASTGGRSEAYARRMFSDLPESAFVEMGEFTGHLLKRAAAVGIETVVLSGMIGKLSKIANRHLMTHVAGNQVDMEYLAAVAGRVGAPGSILDAIRAANSARHVQELVLQSNLAGYFQALCADARDSCQQFVGERPLVGVLMFGFDATLLASVLP